MPDGLVHRRRQFNRPVRFKRWSLFVLTILTLLTTSPGKLAQSATPTPASNCLTASGRIVGPDNALDIGTGVTCASAENASGGQDLYRWEVLSTTDIISYSFSTSPIIDQRIALELYAVEFDDGGNIVVATKLISVTSAPSGSAQATNILLNPGVYYVSVGTSGPGAYSLAIDTGDAPPPISEGEIITAGGALFLSGLLGESTTTIDWEIDTTTSVDHLDLTVQGAAGFRLDWQLLDPDGLELIRGSIPESGISFTPDLGLAPGLYKLTLREYDETNSPWIVTATTASPRSPETEDEPNETIDTAMPIAWEGDSFTLTGRLATQSAQRDDDIYAFTVDSNRAGRLTDIRLIWPGGTQRELCLVDFTGVDIRCAESDAGIALNDLVLTESTWYLRIEGEVAAVNPYVLKINVTGEAVAGFEAEPNNDLALATPLRPNGDGFEGSGRLVDGDADVFRMTVAGEPQLWAIEVTGSGVGQLDLLAERGDVVLRTNLPDPKLLLYDAYLLPGDHLIRVTTGTGDYSITAMPLGPPDPMFEHEPNDDLEQSQPIALLEERTGRIATRNDTDIFRFSLQADSYLHLSTEIPSEGVSKMTMEHGQTTVVTLTSVEPGGDLAWTGWLPAGDYALRVSATTPSLDPYRLLLSPQDPFVLPTDLEPNDTAETAALMPNSMIASGMLDPTANDTDWYLIQPFDHPATVAVIAPPEITVNLRIFGERPDVTLILPAISTNTEDSPLVDVPADVPILVEINGSGPYDIAIELTESHKSSLATPSPGQNGSLVASLMLGDAAPAAYWTTGQIIDGELSLNNHGDTDVTVSLSALTGEAAWTVAFDQSPVTVAAGDTMLLPMAVRVAPDARANQPIYVAVNATAGGESFSTMAFVTPSSTAAPLNPERWLPVPESMLGGLNVAWTSLGAVPVAIDETAVERESFLYNELISTGDGVRFNAEELPAEFTIDLAGDAPIPIAGFVLFPVGVDAEPDRQLREFEVDLSFDGQQWTTVLASSLDSRSVEQSFALDQPIEARFAQLRVISAQSPLAYTLGLGEWKVIADPTWVPGGTPLNLTDPASGGHVVMVNPAFAYNDVTLQLLTPDGKPLDLRSPTTVAPSIVVGFHHDRAAQITGIQWLDALADDRDLPHFETVSIEVSVSSTIGPWTTLGEFPLEFDTNGLASIDLDGPTWARFVRFTATNSPSIEPNSDTLMWALPEQIVVTERPADTSYRSILGEWGTYRSEAIFETLVAPEQVTLDADAGDDRSSATSLDQSATYTDSAAVSADEDWFVITMPEDDATLTITLTGIPSLGVTAALFDADGEEIAVTIEPLTATTSHIVATVTPAASYHLRVTQPPTSVVFAFDTSGSIGMLQPTVLQGLTRFAGDVLPGREMVNILPFGESLVLDQWSDDPYLLQGAILNYPRTSNSSDAEGAIIESDKALSERDGNRAIILITDAENTISPDALDALWSGLGTTAPRIFAINIAGSRQVTLGQDLMQDWSTVNSGQYVYVRNQGEMDVAFDRAATELRRPSIYSVTYDTAPPEPTPTPEPDGALQIEAPAAVGDQPPILPAAPDGQVAIILDTSGSMLQGLEGQTRADIAKSSLVDLVTTTIPAGTSVSLRTFGDTPNSCETILVVPAAPLQPSAMATIIENLPIVNLVRTPIGAALDAVASDLIGTGPKIVVLVTDGEETCDDDPAAAIQALIDSGIDVRVNIVGFAIDDPALQATFTEWAALGHGQYFDAASANELNSAIAQATMPTFKVLDANGTVVATGQIGGDAIALPPGTYQIVVRSNPEITIDQVVVVSGQPVKVLIPGY